jgi:hypothetical protein
MLEEMITITKKEYKQFLKDSNFLGCLESFGVDNWEGYGEAQELYEQDKDGEI